MLIVCKWFQFNSHTSNLIPKRIWRRTTMLTLKFAWFPPSPCVCPSQSQRTAAILFSSHSAMSAWLDFHFGSIYAIPRLSFKAMYALFQDTYSLLLSRQFTEAIICVKWYIFMYIRNISATCARGLWAFAFTISYVQIDWLRV